MRSSCALKGAAQEARASGTLRHRLALGSGKRSPNAYDAYPNPFDATQPQGRRARAYLAANCAQCHLPGGSAPGALDFRFEAGPSGLGVNVPPASGDLGLTNPLIIRPGSKESSVLWERLRRLDGQRMPPLASSVVDRAAVDLLGAWIDAGAE